MFIKGRKSAQIESHLLILQNGIHLLHHLDKICDFLYKRWEICNAAKNLALFYNIFNTKIELETLTRNVQRHVRSNAKKHIAPHLRDNWKPASVGVGLIALGWLLMKGLVYPGEGLQCRETPVAEYVVLPCMWAGTSLRVMATGYYRNYRYLTGVLTSMPHGWRQENQVCCSA